MLLSLRPDQEKGVHKGDDCGELLLEELDPCWQQGVLGGIRAYSGYDPLGE